MKIMNKQNIGLKWLFTFSLLILILGTTYISSAKYDDMSIKFEVNKSVVMLPFRELREVTNETRELYSFEDYKLVESTFGLTFGFNFKIRRKEYFQVNLGYNYFSINDKFKKFNDNNLYAGNAVLSIKWIHFLDNPDRITPFFGIGLGVSLTNSNQENIIWSYESTDDINLNKGEIFCEQGALLSFEGGLLIPIDDKYSLTPAIDINLISHEFIGVYPRFKIGLMRWF